MLGRFLGFLLLLAVAVIFVGLNLGNNSDLRIWFTELGHFKDVPIVFSLMVAYLAGMITSLPFLLRIRINPRKRGKEKKKHKKMEEDFSASEKIDPTL